MAIHHAEALILQVFDLQERDRIVTFLTRERGKVRGVARGARRKYSRFAGQLQPLAKVRVTWFEKEGRDLVRISGVDPLRLSVRLHADLEGILLGSYLAEHLLEFAQENEPGELWFRLLDSTLEALAAGADRDLATRWFEAWVLRLGGIFPAPRECPACGRPFGPEGAVLTAADDGLVCFDCAAAAAGGPGEGGATVLGPSGAARSGAERYGADVVEALLRFGREGLAELAAAPPPPATLRRVEALTARVRRGFLQRELKSHAVMQRTLAEL
ncbi:MAG TPA: DNA repair protein RecO [Thermoanaerobaculia bacterium]|nr:DNA repair protein RecO [Thermoanaerobaculia bacterium]